MKIAYFSPLNPKKTGIADYSEELLPYLAKHAEIDLFVDGYTPTNPYIVHNHAVYDYLLFEKMWWERKYDIALYHMGNDPCHEYIYRTLQQYPGITVLHDFFIHHFIAHITVGKGNKDEYLHEMAYSHGERGVADARRALAGDVPFPVWDYPLSRRVIDASRGIIVHNQFCFDGVRTMNSTVPLARIYHAMETPKAEAEARESLGLDPAAFVVASFGLVTPQKRIDVALRSFKQLLAHVSNVVFLIVGRISEDSDVKPLIEELGLNDVVRVTGHVEKEMLRRYIEACDVCVNLRFPTCGETSGIVLRAMAAAKPVIVSDAGSFAELPDDCSIKVGIDSREVSNVAAALERLANDRMGCREMGIRGRSRVQEEHSPTRIAQEYMRFAKEALAGQGQDVTTCPAEGSRDYGAIELKGDAVDVVEIVRGVRESVRVGELAKNILSRKLLIEDLPESVLDHMLRYHIEQADLVCGHLFVDDQVRPSRTFAERLVTQARKPLHSLVRFYLNGFAERQAGFNFNLAKAMATLVNEGIALGGDQTDDLGELRSSIDSLRARIEILERMLDGLSVEERK
ncbi:MAG: glycosyltransferase family 4 protein [Dehalococcoidales bacterium]|nr:glycosyltransferase family 4 protein [Dehalococcoidales bacterium]